MKARTTDDNDDQGEIVGELRRTTDMLPPPDQFVPRAPNLTPIFLPPYSPELNSIERLSLYRKKRFLSHRLWDDHEAIVDAVCKTWQRVTGDTGRIKSLCSMEWAKNGQQLVGLV